MSHVTYSMVQRLRSQSLTIVCLGSSTGMKQTILSPQFLRNEALEQLGGVIRTFQKVLNAAHVVVVTPQEYMVLMLLERRLFFVMENKSSHFWFM